MRTGQLNTPADLYALNADLQPHYLDWLWISVRAREGEVAAPAGLRSAAQVVVRSWFDERLVQGRYLLFEDRLLLIDDVRDVMGTRVEQQVACSELIGQPATYLPQSASPIGCRVYLEQSAPVIDEMNRVADYRPRAQVALIEVARPQPGEQLVVAGTTYNITGYADESDDGVVRGLWLEVV